MDNSNLHKAMAHRTYTQSSTSTKASLDPMSPDASSQTFCFNKPIPRSAPSAEHNFFGAIKEKIRDRSRSRSGQRESRSRSRSPMPPTRLGSSSSSSASPTRDQQLRHVSSASTTDSMSPTPLSQKRQSTDSSYSYYYGRHSNQWLFGGFSVRESFKGAYHHFRHDSN